MRAWERGNLMSGSAFLFFLSSSLLFFFLPPTYCIFFLYSVQTASQPYRQTTSRCCRAANKAQKDATQTHVIR
ncbi:hypothetical protein BGZ63DRAFT_133148 [Mariannaea sp. PMI_226]|nr:hypothetical protein BGZ63DRAFT_133148 [Mariannaea sp. PMI_226]